MSQDITLAQFRRWLSLFAEQVQEQVDLLTELDAAIGDADHGANMQRGMRKVQERLQDPAATGDDIGSLFRSIAMTLISTVGGAAGPLFGAFFLRAAKDVDGTDAVSLEQLAAMFRSGLEGVQQRGKAQIEEKTMIDALQPAVEALEAAVAEGLDAAAALDRARSRSPRHAPYRRTPGKQRPGQLPWPPLDWTPAPALPAPSI